MIFSMCAFSFLVPGMGYTKIDPYRKYNFSVHHKAELVKAFIFELQLKRYAFSHFMRIVENLSNSLI